MDNRCFCNRWYGAYNRGSLTPLMCTSDGKRRQWNTEGGRWIIDASVFAGTVRVTGDHLHR